MLDIVKIATIWAGGAVALADKLGCKRQAIYQWKVVPAKRLIEIEQATNGRVLRHELRPDLYEGYRRVKE